MLPQVEELATVVVCEDDDPTRELLCDHLTADRYRALPAPSASDALRLCGYNQPDLMLLDLGCPMRPGIDVLREIRSAGERFDPELPVLVLSGARARPIVCAASRPAQTTISRSPSTIRSCWPAWRRCCAAARGPPRTDPARRSDGRSGHPPRDGRRAPGGAGQQGIRSAAGAGSPSRAASSRRTSCCATSGDFARRGGLARSTPTPAACGESSIPRERATSSTAGGSATGCSTRDHPCPQACAQPGAARAPPPAAGAGTDGGGLPSAGRLAAGRQPTRAARGGGQRAARPGRGAKWGGALATPRALLLPGGRARRSGALAPARRADGRDPRLLGRGTGSRSKETPSRWRRRSTI